jgi:hypothetical protein
MSVLCQISAIDNEKQFMEYIKQHNQPPAGGGGWGRFYGEVPAIGTTLQIDWSDYELVNEIPFPQGREKDRERESDCFRVIHHHRHLVPKPEYYSDDLNRALKEGGYAVNVCIIYVVKA